MTKKPNSAFYTKAKSLLASKFPIDKLYDLADDYDITEEEIRTYISTITKSNAIDTALIAVSREQQEAKYKMFDESYIRSVPNVVIFQRGENVTFYNYEDGVYKLYSQFDMENSIDQYMELQGLLDHRTSRNKIKDTVSRIASRLSRTQGRHFSDMDIMKRKYKLNLKNGLFDIETLKLEPHTAEYFTTVQMPFSYDPEAKAPLFEKFLETISDGDSSTIDMLQEMFGYCIGEGNPKHKVFYLYGDTARNGKSTTAKILCGLIGNDNYSTLSLEQIASNNSASMVQLVGKQLNFSDEISSKYIESSTLTTISSEGYIDINPKYKKPFSYQVRSKFIITCNDLPRFQNGQGMKHRMISIPFTYQIKEADRIARYEEKLLQEEGAGILNWAIAGNLKLKSKNTFTINQQSREDAQQNLEESNSVYAFMYSMFDYSKDHTTEHDLKIDLFDPYKKFCVETHVMSKSFISFCIELKRFANETKLINPVRTKDRRYYVGLKIKDYANI